MKNIFTNKFFIIILLFIAITFSFIGSCSAVTIENPYVFTYNDTNYSCSSSFFTSNDVTDFEYFYIFKNRSDESFWFVFTHYPVYYHSNDDVFRFNSSNSSDTSLFTFRAAVFDFLNISVNSNNVKPKTQNNFSSTQSEANGRVGYGGMYDIFYSNTTVLNENGNTVFQQAPAQGEQQGETQGIQTLTLEQAQQIPQAMTQTLQVVVPVGIAIMGILLVIFLVRYLVLRLT